jgi:hypothetical protein
LEPVVEYPGNLLAHRIRLEGGDWPTRRYKGVRHKEALCVSNHEGDYLNPRPEAWSWYDPSRRVVTALGGAMVVEQIEFSQEWPVLQELLLLDQLAKDVV